MRRICRFTSSCTCAKSHFSISSPLNHSIVSNDSVCGQWWPWSDCADAQSNLGLRCPHMFEDKFSHGGAIDKNGSFAKRFISPNCQRHSRNISYLIIFFFLDMSRFVMSELLGAIPALRAVNIKLMSITLLFQWLWIYYWTLLLSRILASNHSKPFSIIHMTPFIIIIIANTWASSSIDLKRRVST